MGKRGRPPKPKEAANEKKCLEYYENWKSAAFTAKQLKLNRHTVEKYFEKFRKQEVEERNESFIQRQRMAKNLCIAKLDEMIDHYEKQVERFHKIVEKDNSTDTADDSQKYEVNYSRIVSSLASLYQQKADLEMTQTLDVKVDELIREKYEEFTSNTDT